MSPLFFNNRVDFKKTRKQTERKINNKRKINKTNQKMGTPPLQIARQIPVRHTLLSPLIKEKAGKYFTKR